MIYHADREKRLGLEPKDQDLSSLRYRQTTLLNLARDVRRHAI